MRLGCRRRTAGHHRCRGGTRALGRLWLRLSCEKLLAGQPGRRSEGGTGWLAPVRRRGSFRFGSECWRLVFGFRNRRGHEGRIEADLRLRRWAGGRGGYRWREWGCGRGRSRLRTGGWRHVLEHLACGDANLEGTPSVGDHRAEAVVRAVDDGAKVDHDLARRQLIANIGGWQLGGDPGRDEIRVESQFMSRLAFQHRSQRDFHFFGS